MPKHKAAQPRQQAEDDEKSGAGFLRLKIPLKDGKPDLSEWDARDVTKAKYRDLINSQEFQQKIGLAAAVGGASTAERSEPEKDDTPAVSREEGKKESQQPAARDVEILPSLKSSDVVWVFDVYAAIVALVFSQILKSDYEIVYPFVKFDKEQKEIMGESLAEIIVKYVPAEYLQYLPEFRLLTMLATITGTNFSRAKEAVEQKKEKPAPAGTSHVTVMSNDKKASA